VCQFAFYDFSSSQRDENHSAQGCPELSKDYPGNTTMKSTTLKGLNQSLAKFKLIRSQSIFPFDSARSLGNNHRSLSFNLYF
jgi:hypothetical protein